MIMAQGILGMALLATLPAFQDAANDEEPQVEHKDDQPLPERQQERLFERYGSKIDQNGDGTITRGEMKAFIKDRGRSGKGKAKGKGREQRGPRAGRGRRGFDPNRDPVGRILAALSLTAEDRPAEGEEIPRQFKKADADGDSTISPEEWAAHMTLVKEKANKRIMQVAPKADHDGDGIIGESELIALRKEHRERMKKHVAKKYMELADTNEDGELSDEEYDNFAASSEDRRSQRLYERFPEADKNNDGKISREEAREFQKDRRRNRKDFPNSKRRRGKADPENETVEEDE